MFPRPILGRSHELGGLRTNYDRAEATLGWVVGPPEVGKTAVVRRAAGDFHHLYHRAPPLSDPQQRAALSRTIAEAGVPGPTDPGDPPSWDALFKALVAGAPEGRPTVLVVDDAHRWVESRARFAETLVRALTMARALGRPVHVTLVAPEPHVLGASGPLEAPTLALAPLPLAAAAPLLPGTTPQDVLMAYAVFGGLPGVLALLDRGASPGTNVRRLVLAEQAPLRDRPLHLLERLFQVPTRYAAILAALASGEGDWGRVHAGVPDLSTSGQAGPYLKRLEEAGLVEVRRSLDASPRTRSRRYRIVDPFLAFWFRFVLPLRHRLDEGEPESLLSQVIRPDLDGHVASVLPQVCRDFMVHEGLAHLGADARECGSLWGPGYEIPVAGTLTSGAPFYGLPVGGDGEAGPSALARLDAQVRETRYGFGRERRLRLLFPMGEVPVGLQREAARRHDTVVVRLDALTSPR